MKKSEFIKVITTIIMNMGGQKPSLDDIEDIMYDLD